MPSFDDRWRAFEPKVTPGPQPGQYAVTFAPKALTADRPASAPAIGRKGPTVYLMSEHGGNLRVIGFDVAGPTDSGLNQTDFEQRAVDVVRESIAAGMD